LPDKGIITRRKNLSMAFPDLTWLEFGDNLRINILSMSDALALIADHLEHRKGFTIATLNLDHAVQLQRPGPFRTAYAHHSHVTADGKPIVWLARRIDPRVEKVSGSDLMVPSIEVAVRLGVPIALIGASENTVLDNAEAVLKQTYPDLQIALKRSPSFPFDPFGPEADAIIAEVRARGAGLVLLALGAPRQEILASRMAKAFPDIGIMSVGASIDFIAGVRTRAPRVLQTAGLEWVWRLILEPGRMGPRYWRCIRILPRLYREAQRRA
jgi:N-acetylglucosaminyldiphosphoundecaprenol N-acetyl-beta-D-mannosaminyltransferase